MLFSILFSIISLISIIGVYNFFTCPVLKISKPKSEPFISILIPARNEEKNIVNCLNSVLTQDYKNYEVIVCDDNSEDETYDLLKTFPENSKLKFFKGKELPDNWLGKSWACQQLSKKAKGELFLFVDADVKLKPQTLCSSVAMMQKKKVSFLSCFPKQIMKTFGEWLLVPIIDWLSLSFIPLYLTYYLKTPKLSIAIGQFILIKKETYLNIGEHKAVAKSKAEDAALARLVKLKGEKILTVRSKGLVTCRMYNNFKESLQGLSRSFYDGSNMKPTVYIFFLALIIIYFILTPGILLIFKPFYLLSYLPFILQRVLTSYLAKQNIIVNLLLMPIHMIFSIILACNSINVSLGKKIVWKGRRIKF